MPLDVMDTLKDIISEYNHNNVEHYIKEMEINKRLQLETWA